MRPKCISIVLFVAVIVCRSGAMSQEGGDANQRWYDRAVAAANAGDLRRATSIAESLAAASPNMASVWYILGDFQIQLHDPRLAAAYWEKYRAIRPEDWKVLPDLIQAYQQLHDTVHREERRTALFRLYDEGKDTSLTSQTEYARDYFRVDSFLVEVYEQFRPKGDREVFVFFYWFSPDGNQIGNFALGSFESDNEFARQRGQLKPGEQVFHLDYNAKASHSTYGFWSSRPGYDMVRALVSDAIRGKVKPISTSIFKE